MPLSARLGGNNMSQVGIEIFSRVLTMAQQSRDQLLKLGSRPTINHQDLMLGHLLDEMKDAIKEKFYRITIEGE